MGISIQQYRAAIGRWHAGKVQMLMPPRTTEPLTNADLDDLHQDHSLVLRGPWKMHAVVLILLMTSLLMTPLASCPHSYRSDPEPGSNYHTHGTHTSQSDFAMLMGKHGKGMAMECLQTLLLIGGVEPNPGPLSGEDVLANLCAQAPDTTIRNTLRNYKEDMSTAQLTKAFKKVDKATLVNTLQYLNVDGQSAYNKDAVVLNLICRIQNLLPDTCNICEEMYCTLVDETPLLKCSICGQGAHTPCILHLLHVNEEEKDNFCQDDVKHMINAPGIPGIHYLCKACEKNVIPQPEEGKLRSQSVSQAKQTDSSEPASSSSLDRNDSEDDAIAEVPVNDRPDPTINNLPAADNGPPLAEPHNPTPDARSVSQRAPNPRRGVCPFYKRGTCRHGMSGNGCNKEHPKACPKLIRHGTRGPRGCSAGNKCDRFHPKMCPQSLAAGECLTTDCKLRHIIGTRRSTSRQTQHEGNLRNQQHRIPTSNENSDVDFLDVVRSMKKEIMEAMDAKIAMITTQLQTTSAPTAPMPAMPVTQLPQIWGLPPQYQTLVGNRMTPVMGHMQIPVSQTHH